MSGFAAADRRWLDAAARVAMPYLGTTAENPTVGALVVHPARQVLLGRGVTALGGRPHAETQALAQAGPGARGATLYVTLEPCNHWGRTPPCAEAVLAAGIARVVIGQPDPDPRTAGASIRRLAEAGLAVEVADHAPSLRLHEGFLSRVTRGRPFVSAKLAVSADGMIGRRGLGNVPVTGEAARAWTHMQRALSDAVLVGAATAALDDPLLTARLEGLEHRSPQALVLAGQTPLPRSLRLFHPSRRSPVAVLARHGVPTPEGVAVWTIEDDAGGAATLGAALRTIGGHGVGGLLVEGGARLTGQLLGERLVDRFHLLTSPLSIGAGGLPASLGPDLEGRLATAGLWEVDRRPLGPDMLRTFERTESCSPAS